MINTTITVRTMPSVWRSAYAGGVGVARGRAALFRMPLFSRLAYPTALSYATVRTAPKESEEQTRLARQLRSKAQEPALHAGALLDWYLERVKESRTRLPFQSADSSESVAFLMRYAAKRRDVYTLRRLRAPAMAWTQRTIQEGALRRGEPPSVRLLLPRLDNMLFGIAAEQNNAKAMHMVVTGRASSRWSPFMCRAYLRTDAALARVLGMPASESEDEAECHAALWTMFLNEFGHLLQASLPDSMQAGLPMSFPPWVTMALLDLYARSGRPDQASALAQAYLAKQFEAAHGTYTASSPWVLRRAPAYLLTDPPSAIPGPALLRCILAAFLPAKKPGQVLQAFSSLTHTPLPPLLSDLAEAAPMYDARIRIELDTTNLLQVMHALRMCLPDPVQRAKAILSLLQCVERQWGVLQPCLASRPFLCDLRPYTQLLELCIAADDKHLARRVLRYQRGALHREQHWIQRNSARAARPPHTSTQLHDWMATLAKLQRRGWMHEAHRKALYAVAKPNVMATTNQSAPTPKARP